MNKFKHIRIYLLCIVFALLGVMQVAAQSYLENIYSAYDDVTVEEAAEITAAKASIKEQYNIIVADDGRYRHWQIKQLTALKELLEALPDYFVTCTRAVYLEPTTLSYEIKYNGFGDEEGVINVGGGAFDLPLQYIRRYAELYNGGYPSDDWIMARFKSMVLRGMAYCYLQQHSELVPKYGITLIDSKFSDTASFSTKLYGIAPENNMIVAPEKNQNWVDFGFAVDMYVTNSSTLQSNFSERYKFISEYVFKGTSISGWQNTQLLTIVEAPPHNGTNENGGQNGENGGENGQNGENEENGENNDNPNLEDRPVPEIPEGNYSENIIITEAQQTEITFEGHSEWENMPASMSEAIRELVAELPIDFARCTRGVAYVPSKDCSEGMSAEGYVFVTQNSWFAPSIIELTDETRKKRFKEYLLREMTTAYLYYHGSVVSDWKSKFDSGMSNADAYKGIQNATVLFYKSKDTPINYLRTIDIEKYDFIYQKVLHKYY